MKIGLDIATASPGARVWWPVDAVYAVDFIGERCMKEGSHVAQLTAFSYSRSSTGWAAHRAGDVSSFAIGAMRRVDRGICLESARTRLSLAPTEIGSSRWSAMGATVVAVLPPEGAFNSPCRIASDGTLFARRNSAPMTLDVGQNVNIKARYRAGTSGQFGIYMQTGASTSLFQGSVGNLTPTTTMAGTWSNPVNVNLGDGLFEVEVDFITSSSSGNWMMGVSARSATAGHYVDVLGAMVTAGPGTTEWIFGDADATVTRSADQFQLHLPAGVNDLSLTYDDATDQELAGVGGALLIDPSALAGRFLRSCVARKA